MDEAPDQHRFKNKEQQPQDPKTFFSAVKKEVSVLLNSHQKNKFNFENSAELSKDLKNALCYNNAIEDQCFLGDPRLVRSGWVFFLVGLSIKINKIGKLGIFH
jgi:hypothetical protein